MIFVFIFGVSMSLSLVIARKLQTNLSPGSNPPYYFLQKDFIKGICSLVGLGLSVLLGFLVYKRNLTEGMRIIFLSFVFYGVHVWTLIMIFFRTRNLFSIERAYSSWATFDDYLYDPVLIGGWVFIFFVVIILGYFLKNKKGQMVKLAIIYV